MAALRLGVIADPHEPSVRLEDELEDWSSGVDAAKVFDAVGLGLDVHDVAALTDRDTYPFDVATRPIVPKGPAGHVVLTHFPVLSFEQRARDAGLLYSGHLSQLAPPVDPLPDDGPVLVLSGHLHLRGVAHEGDVLQLSFAALVEPPYELARVAIESDGDGLMVKYECAAARPADARDASDPRPAGGRVALESRSGVAPALTGPLVAFAPEACGCGASRFVSCAASSALP